MIRNVLLDTGPLIALIDRLDRHHGWIGQQLDNIVPPLLTCEAVLTEACYLVPRTGRPREEPLEFLSRGLLRVAFALDEHHEEVSSLIERYANLPMSLADACLVRMSELAADSVVLTLDRHFRVYRRHRRQKIPLLIPPEL